jgi:hypothetical protein
MAKPQKHQPVDLPEFQPILLRSAGNTETVKSDRDPDKMNVSIKWEVMTEPWASRDPRTTLRVRHGLTVNPKANGSPSIWAQLVNAIHPADLTKTELMDFDSDDVKPGTVVEAVGQITENDQGRFWNIQTYRRPGVQPASAPNGVPASVLAPNGKPFERIENGHGLWFDGTAWCWFKLPEAAPPPPPPPSPAAAPPPPPSPSGVPTATVPAPAGEIRF